MEQAVAAASVRAVFQMSPAGRKMQRPWNVQLALGVLARPNSITFLLDAPASEVKEARTGLVPVSRPAPKTLRVEH